MKAKRDSSIRKRPSYKITAMKPYPPGLTDADVRLEMRRALFYSMCDVIEATCGKDPERIARFKRQKAALERRFGYKGDAIGS